MTGSRSRWWSELALALGLLLGCGAPPPPAFSVEETERALAPAHDLRARCYAGRALERAGKKVRLEYQLDVAADGRVRSVPRLVEPDDAALVECVRHRLDALRFPARGRDRISLSFELEPGPAADVSSPVPRSDR